MNAGNSNVSLSPIDEQRFGIKTAKVQPVTVDNLPSVIEFCKSNNVELLITRSSTNDLQVVHAMEREGFILADTLVYCVRDLWKIPIPQDIGKVPIRNIRPGEEEDVKRVATESFRGYFGHYHSDAKLDKTKCDELYVDWAYRSCISRDVAEQVIVAEKDGAIVGFATLRHNSKEEGEGILFGIAPEAQGLGIYRSFVIWLMNYFHSDGAKHLIGSTQVNNVAVQKSLTRLDFDPGYSYYTFHKWFN